MRGPGKCRGPAQLVPESDDTQSGRDAVGYSRTRLPSEPNAWSENRSHRPRDTANRTMIVPVPPAALRRVHALPRAASLTPTRSFGTNPVPRTVMGVRSRTRSEARLAAAADPGAPAAGVAAAVAAATTRSIGTRTPEG